MRFDREGGREVFFTNQCIQIPRASKQTCVLVPAMGTLLLKWNYAAATSYYFSSPSSTEPKKRSRRNFLCSIICCLGKKRSSHRSKSASSRDHHGARDHSDGGGGGVSGSTTAAAAAAVQPAAKSKHLLPEARPEDVAKKCIVIDLDETLVHSSFKVA